MIPIIVEAIGLFLPLSFGIALSPIPILALVIILMTTKANKNAPAFLLGWILGISLVGILVFLTPGKQTANGAPTFIAGLIRIILGTALLVLAIWKWQQRQNSDRPVEVPKLITRLESVGIFQSAMTGFIFSAIYPKNLVLVIAGAVVIDRVVPLFTMQLIALLVFTALASLSIASPIIAYFLETQKVKVMLVQWKSWLVDNNATILIILLLIFGMLLLGRGIRFIAPYV